MTNHERAQIRAERNRQRMFRGNDCERCGGDLYFTKSGKCNKCINVDKSKDVKRAREERAFQLAVEAHKLNIAYQPWR